MQDNTSTFNQVLYEQLETAIKEQNIDELLELSSEMISEIQSNGRDALFCEDRVVDRYLEQHSIGVAAISVEIGIALGLGEIVLRSLAIAGLLKDLGMSQVDEAIRNKEGTLTIEEFEQVKRHPFITLEMIDNVPGILPMVKTAILHHHENTNGTGYPDGKSEEEIPLIARILHVADVYDAITTDKPYKKSLSKEDALSYLDGGKTLLFDEKVVDAFLESMSYQYTEETIVTDSFEFDPFVTEPSVTTSSRSNKKKILIVDDVYVSILHTKRALGDAYEVVSCVGGSNALLTVKKEKPDLILMDYEMPDMDGATTVMKIHDAGYTMPIIFLTGKSNKETVITCGKTGAVDYVLKPANSVYLKVRVEKALQFDQT